MPCHSLLGTLDISSLHFPEQFLMLAIGVGRRPCVVEKAKQMHMGMQPSESVIDEGIAAASSDVIVECGIAFGKFTVGSARFGSFDFPHLGI